MRPTLTFALTVLGATSILAQDVWKLDEASGFKQFKIGSDFAAYTPQIDPGTGRYNGTCCTTAFGIRVAGILLEPDNLGKLGRIVIDMCPDPKASLEVKQALQSKLFHAIEAAFGSAGGDLDKLTNHWNWVGQRITLGVKYDNVGPNCFISLVYSPTLGTEYGQPNPTDY